VEQRKTRPTGTQKEFPRILKRSSARADSRSLAKGVSKHAFLNLNPSDQPIHLCSLMSLYMSLKIKDLHS